MGIIEKEADRRQSSGEANAIDPHTLRAEIAALRERLSLLELRIMALESKATAN